MRKITKVGEIKVGDYLLFISEGNNFFFCHVTYINEIDILSTDWRFKKSGDVYIPYRDVWGKEDEIVSKTTALTEFIEEGNLFKLNKKDMHEWNDRILICDL